MRNEAIWLTIAVLALGAVPVTAETGTHECTTDVGLGTPIGGPFFDPEISPVSLGGCELVQISEELTVDDIQPAEGCVVSVDSDGDGYHEESANEGEAYPAETTFTAFCQVGTVQATSSITLVQG